MFILVLLCFQLFMYSSVRYEFKCSLIEAIIKQPKEGLCHVKNDQDFGKRYIIENRYASVHVSSHEQNRACDKPQNK